MPAYWPRCGHPCGVVLPGIGAGGPNGSYRVAGTICALGVFLVVGLKQVDEVGTSKVKIVVVGDAHAYIVGLRRISVPLRGIC
jgi:hypothetical protein